MQSPDDRHSPLSAAGRRRKDEILLVAEQALTGRGRARRARRSLAALVVLITGAAWAMAWFASLPPSLERTIALEPKSQSTLVRDASPSPAIAIARLDDAELEAELAALGYDLAVVEIDGTTELFTADGRPFDRAAMSRRTPNGSDES